MNVEKNFDIIYNKYELIINKFILGENMIKYLIMDVDGTLTDGRIFIGNNGEEYKAFNVKDGLAIKNLLVPSGIIPVVITGRVSKIVDIRCKEIGITQIYQGVDDKVKKMHIIVDDLSSVCYIGDDLNDIQCMIKVKSAGGIVVCPNDAVKAVKEVADYVCKNNGGCGAVRECIDYIINNYDI